MSKFKIQGANDSFDNEPLFWSNEDGWGGIEGATVFDLEELREMDFPIETTYLVFESGEKIEVKFFSSDEERENLRTCEICGKLLSFERHEDCFPREGDVCTKCGIFVCPNCVRYGDGESPYCKDCGGK